MTPAILALLLMWSPVTETCMGQSTEGVRYEVAYVYFECPWRDLDEGPPCGRFEVRQDVGFSTRWETVIGSPDPPVGAGWWFEVRSRNASGLWSDGPCL